MSDVIVHKTELPKRLGVIGAGPVGCEMAQTYAQLGSEVFVVESEHGILPREDRDAAEIVQVSMLRDGVKPLCWGKQLVTKNDDGIRLSVESHGTAYDEPVGQLLVCVGRTPNVDNLNLEAMRRAAVSAVSNIVEGCSRSSTTEYVRFLEIAYGSARELQVPESNRATDRMKVDSAPTSLLG